MAKKKASKTKTATPAEPSAAPQQPAEGGHATERAEDEIQKSAADGTADEGGGGRGGGEGDTPSTTSTPAVVVTRYAAVDEEDEGEDEEEDDVVDRLRGARDRAQSLVYKLQADKKDLAQKLKKAKALGLEAVSRLT